MSEEMNQKIENGFEKCINQDESTVEDELPGVCHLSSMSSDRIWAIQMLK